MKDKLNYVVCESSSDYGILTEVYNYIEKIEKENQQLKDNWNELMEDIPHILEMIEHNKDVIKVTSDEELAIYSLQNKMRELEQRIDNK